jgi:citrate synthase
MTDITNQDGLIDVPRGLKGVVAASTEIGDVRGAEGFYHYRQHSAIELAESRTLEDVWFLMIDGHLPDAVERARFAAEVAPLRAVPGPIAALLPAIAAASSSPFEAYRSALSLLSAHARLRPMIDLQPDERRHDALVVCAVTPTLLAALGRLARGLDVIEPRSDLPWAANYLWMLLGAVPDPERVRAVEQYLISTVDHGFNASTFTARVVASTGADIGAAIVAATAALSGPLHGGAPSRALDLLDELPDPARAEEVLGPRLAAGEKVMGFGHAVYRGEDPRSVMLRSVAARVGGSQAAHAMAVEAAVVDVLGRHRPERGLRTNVEFYAGVVMEACGIPREMFTPTFASSRVIGWCAHALEQAADGKILRPSSRYVGIPPTRGGFPAEPAGAA